MSQAAWRLAGHSCTYHHIEVILPTSSVGNHSVWPHLMRDVPALQGRTGTPTHYSKDAQAMKSFHILVFLSFLSFLSLLSSLTQLSSSLSFHQLFTKNHGLHLHLIQTLCLHLSRSTPLRKVLTVNHYLRIEYFQRYRNLKTRVMNDDYSVTYKIIRTLGDETGIILRGREFSSQGF